MSITLQNQHALSRPPSTSTFCTPAAFAMPRELDPFVDRRRSHSLGFEFLEDADTFLFRLRASRMFEWVLSMTGEATIRPWKRYTLKQP